METRGRTQSGNRDGSGTETRAVAETGTGTGAGSETAKGTRVEREGAEEVSSGIHHIRKEAE